MLTEQTTTGLTLDPSPADSRKKAPNQEGLKTSRALGNICERTVTDVWAGRTDLSSFSEDLFGQLRQATQKTALFLNSFHDKHPEIKERAAQLEEKKRGRLDFHTRFGVNRRHDVFAAPYQALENLSVNAEGFVDVAETNRDWSKVLELFETIFPEGTRGHQLIDAYHSILSKHRQNVTPNEIYYPVEAVLATARVIDHLKDFLGWQFVAYVATCAPGTNRPSAQYDGLSLSRPFTPTKRGTFDFWGLLGANINYQLVDLKTLFRKAYVRSEDTVSGLLVRERRQSKRQVERILMTYGQHYPGQVPNLPEQIQYYYLRGSHEWRFHRRQTLDILTDLKEQTEQDLDSHDYPAETREKKEALIATINQLT